MDRALRKKDLLAIRRYEPQFTGEILEESGLGSILEYPKTYKYILLLDSVQHDSGYSWIRIIGKGLDGRFYHIETYDYVNFSGGIKIDYYRHIARVLGLKEGATGMIGILKIRLEAGDGRLESGD